MSTNEEQAEYFAQQFTGQQKSIEDTLWEGMDRWVALAALQMHVQQKEQPVLWVETWLDKWEEAVRQDYKQELDKMKEMQDSPAGKLLGTLAPDPEEIEEDIEDAIASIREDVRSVLLSETTN